MSLESALEEERLEILKILERPAPRPRSGAQSTPNSPRQAYSSLTRPISPHRPVTSLIDEVAGLPPRSSTPLGSGRASPVDFNGSNAPVHYRTRSDASNNPPPRLLGRGLPSAYQSYSPNEAYDFSMIPTVGGSAPRKRTASQPSMLSTSGVPGRSKSPLGNPAFTHGRAMSPPSSRVASPSRERHTLTGESGSKIDLDYAYARLNDSALAASGGTLASLPGRKPITDKNGELVTAGTGESLTQDGGVRLQMDLASDERAIVDSSDEEDSTEEDDSGEAYSDEEGRGRTSLRGRKSPSLIELASEPSSRGNSTDRDSNVGVDPGGGKKKKKGKKGKKGEDATTPGGKRKIMSLLGAAEEERKKVSSSSKYQVRSLLPQISVTPTSSNYPGATSPTTSRRSGVHPSTNFDLPSQVSTPVSSDQEADDIDIRRAQRMETLISPIYSTPETHRVVRTILRGDYEGVHKAILERGKRVRKYLVATDMSSEAQYAMEWTIGTVLRDGDTLIAICAVDHDTIEDGSKPVPDNTVSDALVEVSDQARAAALGSLTPPVVNPHTPGTSSPLKELHVEQSRERTKAERERSLAAEHITALVTKLLKKTRLQVKVVVEVIHCKSPKHLLTEIIDLIEPTLVVLGSRGRSALKGVLLGSFSNYLVAKSSVPVMVARKKLKHTKKYSQTNIRLTNNLTSNTARILANAKVD